jgi:DNA-directed RNA polymerase specialized sigma subunit
MTKKNDDLFPPSNGQLRVEGQMLLHILGAYIEYKKSKSAIRMLRIHSEKETMLVLTQLVDMEWMTLDEVGEALGITRERVRQLIRKYEET